MDFRNTNTIEIPTPSTTENLIRIPDGVECIPELHYLGCDQLEIIYIPTTVRKIEDYAFKGCSRLKMVYIPEGVTTIGVGCFCDCVDLIMVHIPNSVRDIKKEAFKQCKNQVFWNKKIRIFIRINLITIMRNFRLYKHYALLQVYAILVSSGYYKYL